jgi:hypothetical protein
LLPCTAGVKRLAGSTRPSIDQVGIDASIGERFWSSSTLLLLPLVRKAYSRCVMKPRQYRKLLTIHTALPLCLGAAEVVASLRKCEEACSISGTIST